MKQKIYQTSFLAAALLSTSLAYAVPKGDLSQADSTLNIIHFNDMHARFEPVNKYNSTCGAEELAEAGKCFGGIARLKTAIDVAKEKTEGDALVLSAGDTFQGSLFYTFYKGKSSAEFMEALSLDAFTLGNHEFDDGQEVLLDFAKNMSTDLLFSNVAYEEGNMIEGEIKPYTIKEVNGHKVAIIGILAEDTAELAPVGKGLVFTKVEEVLPKVIAEIKEQNVNKIILLSHVGLPRDRYIAQNFSDIDAIVGGHTHSLLMDNNPDAADNYPAVEKNPEGIEVPIVQAQAYSQYLGHLTLGFDDKGEVVAWDGAPQRLDDSIEENAELKARVTELAAPLDEIRNKLVTNISRTFIGTRDVCRAQECDLGNAIADAMLDRTYSQGVTVAIQNGGGIRASIEEGDVTMGDVLTVLPFQNTLATFEIDGAGLLAALENGASQIEEGAGRYAQVAGLRYQYDVSKPAGERIVKAQTFENDAWVDVDPSKSYKVATNDYVRNGGDGFAMFVDAQNAYDFGPNLENVLIDFLVENPDYDPAAQGRILSDPSADFDPKMPAPIYVK